MNLKNKEIRAHARRLLDDNVFGKDWMKGAFVHILVDLIILGVGHIAHTVLTDLVLSSLLNLVEGKSVILFYGLPFIFVFIELLALCLIIGPVQVGIATVYLDLIRGEGKVKIGKLFLGFKNFVGNFILGVMYVLQVTLWSLFLVIPGIYVAYSYALVFHIKKDHPEYRWKQCLDESERLMDGNRWRLFKLQLSHIGWFIVGLAFVGIGAYWAEPYLDTSTAIFYEDVRLERGVQ